MIRPTTIPALALLLLSASSCAGPHWSKERELVRSAGLRVELERWTGMEATPIPLAHPVEVDRGQLRTLLGSIEEQPRGVLGSETVAVVSQDRLDPLVDALVEALATARSDERVRFALENPTRAFGLFPALRLTRGVAFVDSASELHVVFDLVNSQGDGDLGQWGDPTRRRISRSTLVLPPTARRHVDTDGQQRELWIVQTLNGAAAKAGVTPTEVAAGEGPARTTPPPVTATESEPPRNALPGVDDAALRRIRLEFLEELRREGLLGERAYQDKRAELESGSH